MKNKFLACCLLILAPIAKSDPMTSVYSNQEMDIEDAHLNKHFQRLDEVAAAHSKYAAIRSGLIDSRYKKPMFDWYIKAQDWFKNWEAIIRTMHSEELADAQVAEDTVKNIKAQMAFLERLEADHNSIRSQGDSALAALNSLPTFPDEYIDVDQFSSTDSYADFMRVYKNEVKTSRASIESAQTQFAAGIMQNLRKFTELMDQGLTLRMTALMIKYPALKEQLGKLESSLVSMRELDEVLARLDRQSSEVRITLQAKKIYGASKKYAEWKLLSQEVLAKIEGNRDLSEDLQDYARNLVTIYGNRVDADFNRESELRSKVSTFAQYYQMEMNGPVGLVQRCLNIETRTSRIDCNLLRLVQGFERKHILSLNDEQASYIEQLIEKAKLGTIR